MLRRCTMRRVMASLLLLILIWMGAIWPHSTFAQSGQAQSFTLVTPFPSQEIGLGETVTIPLTLRAATTAQIIHLALENLPNALSRIEPITNYTLSGRLDVLH